MPSYKVVYFDGRGRAELTRLVFGAAGQAFEDVRVKDWPNGKESAPLGNTKKNSKKKLLLLLLL
jgi:hypothetical protein